MCQLQYIIVDKIPPQEIRYLRSHVSEDESIQLVELSGTEKERRESVAGYPPEQSIFLAEDAALLSEMRERGMTVLAFAEREKEDQTIPEVDFVVEGFEEVNLRFLQQVYQRRHHLPWTILETKRCIVREFTLDDLDDLFALYAGEGMTDYIEPLYEYEKEKEYQISYMKYMYGFYGYGMWLVIDKESGKLIGRAGIENREELCGELELGYAIGVPWQRKGYATEVCLAIMEYAKEELECEKLNCLIEQGNTVSEHVAEKLGFVMCEELDINQKRMKRYEISWKEGD